MDVRRIVSEIRKSDDIVDYIVDIVRASREHASLHYGASPRAANMLATATRAYAALQGRDFAIPDDVKFLFLPTMRHRIVLAPAAEVEGTDSDQVLGQILEQVPAPR